MGGDAEVVQRLLAAAGRSGAGLVAEAARLTGGWAALVDPLAGAVYSTPRSAAADAEHAATGPPGDPGPMLHPAAGAVLVIAPADSTPAERTGLVARTTAALLQVRARRATELRAPQMRLHTAALRLLLRGQTGPAADILGTDRATRATVYRLTGSRHDLEAAHQALWQAARPSAGHLLISLHGDDLAVIELHGDAGSRTLLRLVSHAAERHSLLGGIADPAPLDLVPAAWTDAASARNTATTGHRLAPAPATGDLGLLRIVPQAPLAAWAAAVLAPLGPDQRHLLAVWLRTGSTEGTATATGVSAATVRARLHTIAALLGTDLNDATVQAHLLLALHPPPAPTTATSTGWRPPPADVLDPARTRAWAAALLHGLDTRRRTALRCWLAHRGATAPAAAELHVHRTTLTRWLTQTADHLGLDLSSPTTRAELHLAALTDPPTELPRRGGRTYRTNPPPTASASPPDPQ
ncbi:helix-turn-helix domain-containing protein [Streptomyces sp. NPDC004610]|uniref:helix-turn-helix domain-containing protein n=1 Tax=unclassified Streptomyces TaxID=2593676 RepID=UPI0033A56553